MRSIVNASIWGLPILEMEKLQTTTSHVQRFTKRYNYMLKFYHLERKKDVGKK